MIPLIPSLTIAGNNRGGTILTEQLGRANAHRFQRLQFVDTKEGRAARLAEYAEAAFPQSSIGYTCGTSQDAIAAMDQEAAMAWTADSVASLRQTVEIHRNQRSDTILTSQIFGQAPGSTGTRFGLVGLLSSQTEDLGDDTLDMLKTLERMSSPTSSQQLNPLTKQVAHPFRRRLAETHAVHIGELEREPQDKTFYGQAISFGREMLPLHLLPLTERLRWRHQKEAALAACDQVPDGQRHQNPYGKNMVTALIWERQITLIQICITARGKRRVEGVVDLQAPAPKAQMQFTD